ncbi:MAG: glycosyltransferase family 4 protein [Magnetococcus sp. WYHC-3]
MRLSFVCHEFPPVGGGAASALDRFTQVLAARGHQVQVVTIALGDAVGVRTDPQGRQVVRLAAGRRARLSPGSWELARSVWTLRRHAMAPLQAFDADAVIAYFAFPAGWAVLPVVRRLDKPLLVSLRGSDVPGFFAPRWGVFRPLHPRLVLPVLRQAQRVMANGACLAELARPLVPGLPVVDLPNGIDTERFSAARVVPDPREPLRILYVGQLIPRKHCLELMDALAWLADQGVPARATVVGEGPLAEELAQRQASVGSAVSVRMLGVVARERMPEIYAAHDLLVHLSEAEGVSNVVLEALASGLALVATPRAVGPDLARSAAVRLVEKLDPPTLGAVLRDLATHRQHLERMSQAALPAARGFDWTETAVRFEALLEEVVADWAA